MFERFTERARRSIFFARIEASVYGSRHIESEHLLLGILRDDPTIRANLPVEEVRNEIERRAMRKKPTSTAVDIPLSIESQRALAYAAEEAERASHEPIDCVHLIAGLTRIETSLATQVLREHGFATQEARDLIRKFAPALPPPLKGRGSLRATSGTMREAPPEPLAPSLEAIVEKLDNLVHQAAESLEKLSEADLAQPLPSGGTRPQMLGHLIDWATAHHQWFLRALEEADLVAPEYPRRDPSKTQHYRQLGWLELVPAWISVECSD
jgi:ATP-dependent Clp protease ATP-binding subunit ClpA